MARMILTFILTWVSVTAGIHVWRGLNNLEKWKTTKVVAFGFVTAVTTTVVLTMFVFLF